MTLDSGAADGARATGPDGERGRAFFVYGTLRPGGRNHRPWLDGRLAGVHPARLSGHTLHHHAELPYVTADGRGVVVGDLVAPTAHHAPDVLADLDRLEGVAVGHYVRVAVGVEVDGAEVAAWVYVAGPLVAAELGASTVVADGDWAPWLATH